jgi:hypothetical protein
VLHRLKLLPGRLNRAILKRWAAPVLFESEHALREVIREWVADEITAVVAEDVSHVTIRIPAESGPDRFVNVVVATFRVGDEPDGWRLEKAEDVRVGARARVHTFARLGERERRVPVRHRELTLPVMRNVGVMAQLVFRRQQRAKFHRIEPHLGAEDDAGEPRRLFLAHDGHELVPPLLRETLRRNPHLRLGMITMQVLGLLRQQRQE